MKGTTLQDTKYSRNVMDIVRASLGVDMNSTELDAQIDGMPKVKVMDIVLDNRRDKASGKVIREAVYEFFKVDLDVMSDNNDGKRLSSYPLDIMQGVRLDLKLDANDETFDSEIMNMPKVEIMDRFYNSFGKNISGEDSRRIVNEIFGFNVRGIESLEKARLSLYSKGRWMTKNDTDIFMVITARGDVHINATVTNHYVEMTGSDQFPVEMQKFLTGLGFIYEADDKMYHFTSPTGESVSDAFKDQLIGTLVRYIAQHYAS